LVIILDTNQLIANRTLDTPALDVLQAIANAKGEQLALPTLVVDEFMAKYRHSLEEAIEALQRADRELRELARHPGEYSDLPIPQQVIAEQTTRLLDIFKETLPLAEGTANEALRRELRRQRPASTDWKKASGARNVAI
jgi:hypothetical protein